MCSGHFFFQPQLLTGLSYRSGSSHCGKIRISSKTRLICTFALRPRIFPTIGSKLCAPAELTTKRYDCIVNKWAVLREISISQEPFLLLSPVILSVDPSQFDMRGHWRGPCCHGGPRAPTLPLHPQPALGQHKAKDTSNDEDQLGET